ncbi:hypothetical protein IB244_31205 [Rhizobium sp. RHZ02]|uniref:hypothetical protein n=1 Tax=Rhizobium sp. RHZ02 TaxID=2769306 RepID=UPI001786C491|nr:hypothetical protein [Rhizobium sp. RHZ02]MBD9455940.1 hypothetical protein [Rhizobium sp. RHZ02]
MTSYPKILKVSSHTITCDDGTEFEIPVYQAFGYPVFDKDSIDNAIAYLNKRLPGWWYTAGECSVSSDATVGPDRAYIREPFLSMFDDGFSVDLAKPSTVAEALKAAVDEAFKAYSTAIQNNGGGS